MKVVTGNLSSDKWKYYDEFDDLLEIPLNKIMLFIPSNELLLCGSKDTILSALEKLKEE